MFSKILIASSALSASAFFGVVPPPLQKSTKLSAYGVNVKLQIKEDRRDELIDVVRANAEGVVNAEPSAISYDWGESPRNTFHFHEQYTDEAGE